MTEQPKIVGMDKNKFSRLLQAFQTNSINNKTDYDVECNKDNAQNAVASAKLFWKALTADEATTTHNTKHKPAATKQQEPEVVTTKKHHHKHHKSSKHHHRDKPSKVHKTDDTSDPEVTSKHHKLNEHPDNNTDQKQPLNTKTAELGGKTSNKN